MLLLLLLLLLLSHFSRVRLCVTPQTAAHQAPLSLPGILQARTLERVAISFSSAWKWKVKVKSLSHIWLLVTPWTAAHQAPPSMGFSRQEYWSGVPCLLWYSRCPQMFSEWLTYFINTHNQPCRTQKHYHSCFTDEETEAQMTDLFETAAKRVTELRKEPGS